jgi:hypothetical protein
MFQAIIFVEKNWLKKVWNLAAVSILYPVLVLQYCIQYWYYNTVSSTGITILYPPGIPHEKIWDHGPVGSQPFGNPIIIPLDLRHQR